MNVNEILTDPASAPHGTIVVKAGVAYVKNTEAATYNGGDYRDPRRYPWLSVTGATVAMVGSWDDETVQGGTIVYVPDRPIKVGSTFTAQEMRDRVGDFRSGTVAVRHGGIAVQLRRGGWDIATSDKNYKFDVVGDDIEFEILHIPD